MTPQLNSGVSSQRTLRLGMTSLDRILDALDHYRQRATYGAVAG
jgi:hypothetical protein